MYTGSMFLLMLFHIKMGGTKAPKGIHCPLGLQYQPLGKATVIVGCSENQSTPHNLCDEIHKLWVETGVQALLQAADNTSLAKARPCDTETTKIIETNKCLRTM
jgi:hypothetical protein